jgi:CRISPR/Cas system-associated exonuclease Cas4 (RecB family)
MKTIRASEIGAYLYCKRAWWYQKNGYQAQNQAELSSGSRLHERHGLQVLAIKILRWLAYALFLTALAVAIVAILLPNL